MFRFVIKKSFLLIAIAAATTIDARTEGQGIAKVDFARDIQPILSDKCFTCHGPDEGSREADLRLDTEAGLAESGVVMPGEPSESELLRRLTSEDSDERMPPVESNLSLTSAEIQKIESWIESGAKWSGHWAYQRITRPPLPDRSDLSAIRRDQNPIDRFVAAVLSDNQLLPAAEASREVLIRRVTLDLTGLPPTLSDLDAYLSDGADDAYEKVVDRLIASPAYGERMAWPWLDVARYADTNGFQGDRERTMWPWRDWVIDSVNRNMSFDRFTILQLAGDLLPNATEVERLATGFCRNHMINGEGGRIPAENRVEYIFDQIETVGTTWLGMTLQCCRCHDHKFDPVSQDEYYKLFAFFNQTPVNGGGGDPQTAPTITVASDFQQRKLRRAESDVQDAADHLQQFEKENADRKTMQEMVANEETEGIGDALKTRPGRRSNEQLDLLRKKTEATWPEYSKLVQTLHQRREHLNAIKRSLPKVMVMEDMTRDKHRATHVLDRGLYNKPLHEVSSAIPSALPELSVEGGALPSRLDLANWLVDGRNPLTARVVVNRIWQTFFGTGIVETVEDLGVQSKRPSHPLLLDWLAAEFIRSGWDSKHIVRLIVTSATYRQSSKNLKSVQVDPANRSLARGPRFRLPAWMLRDQALAISGMLVERQGGRPVKPYQPDGVWADATFGKKRYQPDDGENLYRRSIYVFWRRIVGPTMFFDGGKRQTCEVKVARTNTPLHALATLNDVTYVEASRAMAERVLRDVVDNDKTRIDYAFRLATSRWPSRDERNRLIRRLEQLKKYYRDNEPAARELLENGKSSRDETLETSEHAAYTCICLLILNLDETLTN